MFTPCAAVRDSLRSQTPASGGSFRDFSRLLPRLAGGEPNDQPFPITTALEARGDLRRSLIAASVFVSS
jgi:hypothetical protein